nr:hypothetical protein [Tanacetum cinerariifolium]
ATLACQLSYHHQANYLMSSFPTGRRFLFPQINEEGRSHLILPKNQKRSVMPWQGDEKGTALKKLGFPMLLHTQRDAPTSGCFTPNPTSIPLVGMGRPTTSLSLRPGTSQWGDPVRLLPPKKEIIRESFPSYGSNHSQMPRETSFPLTVPISTNRCFQIRLPVDISSNSSIREANCCVEESISRHKPRGRSCATPPGRMKLACILAPKTLS